MTSGNPAYQAAWTNNVASFLSATGAESVFIDDVLVGYRRAHRVAAIPPSTRSQASWADAMVSFIDYVGPALKAKGFYVLVNADGYSPGNGSSDTGELTATIRAPTRWN